MENSKFKSFIKSNMMWVILILIVVIFAFLSPNFRSFRNIMNILTQNAYFIVATIGVAMIMISDQLKIGVVTGHIPLKDVPTAITKARILGKLRLMKASLQRDFGVIEPKIAVLGLNPHCGDGGLLGDEEQSVILPAVQQAVSEGIAAFGPYSPDGFFGMGNYGRFDATLAMYHDQGLAPFKAISFQQGVNFTAGLPIVRTSPDHGTAYEMAGRDAADPHSMMCSIYGAIDIWRKRQEYDRLLSGRMKKQDND